MTPEPFLMPFQDQPFNGDTFIEQEFIQLRDNFKITTAIETGTCFGYTTVWLAQFFEKVYTIELNKTYADIARSKFLMYPNITSIHGNSEDIIRHLKIDGQALFFLDAHWGNRCPLLNELYEIYKLGLKPAIAIHDFLVPDSDLGYDSFKGQPFTMKWIEKQLQKIYGLSGFDYYYNSKAVGARRGIVYITPKA